MLDWGGYRLYIEHIGGYVDSVGAAQYSVFPSSGSQAEKNRSDVR